MTMWRMRIACWIPKVTNAHSEYVILIAFQLQQWLQERVPCLLVTEMRCLLRGTNWIVYNIFQYNRRVWTTTCSAGVGEMCRTA
jgi:hypothetical protein